jgi:hypothetical protein
MASTFQPTADPDARYNKHKGTGYLVQIMKSFVEDDLASKNTDNAEQDDSHGRKEQ